MQCKHGKLPNVPSGICCRRSYTLRLWASWILLCTRDISKIKRERVVRTRRSRKAEIYSRRGGDKGNLSQPNDARLWIPIALFMHVQGSNLNSPTASTARTHTHTKHILSISLAHPHAQAWVPCGSLTTVLAAHVCSLLLALQTPGHSACSSECPL